MGPVLAFALCEMVRMFKSVNSTAQHIALETFMKCSQGLSSVCPGKCSVQLEQMQQVRDIGRLVACVVRRVKMKEKAPFSTSRHVVSDLSYGEINLPGNWSLMGEVCSTELPGLRGMESRLWC